jgi:hypothetical protein
MAVKSLHQFFYYHSKYLNSMKCQEISMGPSIGEIQCTIICVMVPVNEFFLAFKSQFAPKCKRWYHGIGTLNAGKPQKKAKKVDNLGKGRPDV